MTQNDALEALLSRMRYNLDETGCHYTNEEDYNVLQAALQNAQPASVDVEDLLIEIGTNAFECDIADTGAEQAVFTALQYLAAQGYPHPKPGNVSEEMLEKAREYLESHAAFSEQPNGHAKDAYVYHLCKAITAAQEEHSE